MPPRKDVGSGKNKANKPYSRPDPIASGEVLTDQLGKQWKIGKSVGVGGFGEIYLASDDVSKSVNDKANYVIKIEPLANGPLFVEIAFYIRAAKADMVEEWKRSKKLDSLGMPSFVASGTHEYRTEQYRFLVLPRYTQDLHKILQDKPGKKFAIRTVQALAIQTIDVLEYIHSKNFVHGDIKASNLMIGQGGVTSPGGARNKKPQQQIFLLDYGLATKFVDPHGRDNRRAHNGTLEYTSRDAHVGAFSRRGDLEILGYNMMEWLCGKLPWSAQETPDAVNKQKIAFFMSNVNLRKIYPVETPGLEIIEKFLKYVQTLAFEQAPNYNHCKELLGLGKLPSLTNSLYLEDVVNSPSNKSKKQATKRVITEEDLVVKKIRLPLMDDDDQNPKRSTRTTRKVKHFNWARVLSSDPEKMVRAASLSQGSSKESSLSPKIPSPIMLTNPTPAMLQILSKKKENLAASPFKGRVLMTNDEEDQAGDGFLTPAMKEVLKKKANLGAGSSSGNSGGTHSLRPRRGRISNGSM